MSYDDLLAKWNNAQDKVRQAKDAIQEFERFLAALREEYVDFASKLDLPMIPSVNTEDLKKFMQQPYIIIPKKQDRWYVIVPKFINLQLGYLEYDTPTFNVFVINKYIRMMTPLPKEIDDRLGVKPQIDVKVVDGILKVPSGMEEEFWTQERKYLYKKDQFGLRIKKGYELQLLSDLIRRGYAPWSKLPVDPDELREPPSGFELKPYQKDAFDKWLEWGAIGIYWAGGMGKTYLGAAITYMVKGLKLIVVPNISEKEQWLEYLRKFGASNYELMTYQSFHKAQNKQYTLIIFDECHRLPAPIWSRFATLQTKYRLGFSATPYREDGREDLIMALTGYPVGLSWDQFLQAKTIRKPRVICKVVPTDREKMLVLEDLLKVPLKTLIFVELIASGEKIKKRFNIPFVYGATKNRLELINKNLTTVVSRVGDEGISVKQLERTIEVEFLGKSRRQEAQRAYRLLHSVREDIIHIIIMTVKELDKFGKRFLALEEKGFRVDYEMI